MWLGNASCTAVLYSQVYTWRRRVHVKLAVKYMSDTEVCVLLGVVTGLCLHPVAFPAVLSLHLLGFVLDPFFLGRTVLCMWPAILITASALLCGAIVQERPKLVYK